ncbi:MAG: hypothetical protein HOP37_08815 [Cyclobacteriaceae bacterium]|nr:hypothetical protein [Cyclobacteriaceae bacterium]
MTTATETFFKSIQESTVPSYFSEGQAIRETAFQRLMEVGLPSSKSEEYRFTPITKALEKKLIWETSTQASTLSSIEPFLIPGLDAHLIVLINGAFAKQFSNLDELENSVTVTTFAEANSQIKEKIVTQLGSLNKSDDAFSLLNNAF